MPDSLLVPEQINEQDPGARNQPVLEKLKIFQQVVVPEQFENCVMPGLVLFRVAN